MLTLPLTGSWCRSSSATRRTLHSVATNVLRQRHQSKTKANAAATTAAGTKEKHEEAGKGAKTTEMPPGLDSPPLIFVAKYGRVIDTRYVGEHLPAPPPPRQIQDELSELEKKTDLGVGSSEAARRVKMVVDAVAKTKTVEAMIARLKEKQTQPQQPLFEAGKPKTVLRLSHALASDDETVPERRSAARPTRLHQDDDAELLQWTDAKLDLRSLPSSYLMLSKSRLTLLVCITSAAGYGLAPGVFDPAKFAIATLGTALVSSSANSVNQFLEVPFDAQMNRTRNRVLVRGLLTPKHAVGFAVATGASGIGLLYAAINPLTAGLAAFNLFLYTSVYTPMKRISIANTWVGSVVGAIPPLMGWTACTGSLDAGCVILAGILYAWQFPHFNSLSWNLRPDYSKAGYRMMSVTDPALCRRVALRYSIGCIGICTLAPILNVTDWYFAVDSLPLNLYLSYLAWRFYRDANSSSSRKLFKYTLIHLPLLLALMFLCKKSVSSKAATVTAEGAGTGAATAKTVDVS